jgi:dienelactone hydrolase
VTLQRTLRACLKAVWFSAITLTAQACAPVASPVVTASAGRQPATVAPDVVLQTSVAPQADEDLAAACRYELTLINSARRVAGVWVIFERSLDMLRYYQDADVRAFARRHDLALLFPFHCASKSETGGDMNVDPSKGIGRALFAALTQLAEGSGHPELASSRLILLGFSGTGSLVGRLAEFAPHRVIAVIPTVPGHFDPLGMDTIKLSPEAAAIPHLVLAGGADAVSGTERPYSYFRRHFDSGGPWTFVVQNGVPHCCMINAKPLVLEWLDGVAIQGRRRPVGRYGFIETRPSEATGCPGQSPPVRPSWCQSTSDTWGGANWSVKAATIERRPNPPQGMMPSGWLPTDAFARRWISFVTQPEHPVTMPP